MSTPPFAATGCTFSNKPTPSAPRHYTAEQFLAVVNRYADLAERHAKLSIEHFETSKRLYEVSSMYRQACEKLVGRDSRPVDVPPADVTCDSFVEYVAPTLRVPSLGKLPALLDPAKVRGLNVVVDPYCELPHVVGEWPTEPGWYWLWSDNSMRWKLVEYDRFTITQLIGNPNHVLNWRRIGPLPSPPVPNANRVNAPTVPPPPPPPCRPTIINGG